MESAVASSKRFSIQRKRLFFCWNVLSLQPWIQEKMSWWVSPGSSSGLIAGGVCRHSVLHLGKESIRIAIFVNHFCPELLELFQRRSKPRRNLFHKRLKELERIDLPLNGSQKKRSVSRMLVIHHQILKRTYILPIHRLHLHQGLPVETNLLLDHPGKIFDGSYRDGHYHTNLIGFYYICPERNCFLLYQINF